MSRSEADWEAIERDFRLGAYSVREIAKRHGVNHSSVIRRARSYGWTQDKSAEVRARVRARLSGQSAPRTSAPANAPQAPRTKAPREPGPPPTEEDIEAAVEERVAVSLEHQRATRDCLATLENLRRELDEVNAHRDEIEEDIEEETAGDKNGERRARMRRAVSLPSRVQSAVGLSTGIKTAITTDRLVRNMDEPEKDASGLTIKVVKFGDLAGDE